MPRSIIIGLLVAVVAAIGLDAATIAKTSPLQINPDVQQAQINSMIHQMTSQELETERLREIVQGQLVVTERRFTILETQQESTTWYLRVIAAGIIGMLIKEWQEFRNKQKQQKQQNET